MVIKQICGRIIYQNPPTVYGHDVCTFFALAEWLCYTYIKLEPEELVYIHELTDEDVRRRLEELEQWYGMSSEEFYCRWQQGEADDVFEKIEWRGETRPGQDGFLVALGPRPTDRGVARGDFAGRLAGSGSNPDLQEEGLK